MLTTVKRELAAVTATLAPVRWHGIAAVAWVLFAGLAVAGGVLLLLIGAVLFMDTGGYALPAAYPVFGMVVPVVLAVGLARRILVVALVASAYGTGIGVLLLAHISDPGFSGAGFIPGLLSVLAANDIARHDGPPRTPLFLQDAADNLEGVFPHRRLVRWLVALVFVGALSLAIVNVGLRINESPVDRLYARPEATLYYPGSVQVRAALGTNATVDEVIAFYQRELSARGFTPGGGLAVAGSLRDLQVCAWHTPELVFRLAFWKIDDWQRRVPDGTPYPTMYDISLLDYQNTEDRGECMHPLD